MCCALAEREAGKLNDEYISTEHILLALANAQGGDGELAEPQRRHPKRSKRRSRPCAGRIG